MSLLKKMGKRPSIAGVIDELSITKAERAKEMGADVLELRIDLCGERDTYKIRDFLKEIRKEVGLPVIATNRMRKEGGFFDGTEEERISILASLLDEVDAVDVELAARNKNALIEGAKEKGVSVILSYHDFSKTPEKKDILKIIRNMFYSGADISKIALTAKKLKDVITLLEVTLETEEPIISISMGEIGKHSRIIAPLYGSIITYGFVEREAAPGQLSISELKTILDIIK
ncbi:MAG: type I 3-dehydroquinate dehydratase [Candidatus Syntropharchaeia archaeon]